MSNQDEHNEATELEVTHHHPQLSITEMGAKLKLAIFLNSLIIVAQVIGGVIANSLGLLSDAGHNFTDLAALFLSFYAISISLRPATEHKSFGFHRAGILAALANAVALLLITAYIFYEAYKRILNPPEVEGTLMIVVAGIAFVANLWIALMLRTHAHENINLRSAFLHMLGDALASIGVVIAGVILIYTGWPFADPLISIIIGVVIAIGAWKIAEESVHILLEGTPRNLSSKKVIEAMNELEGVDDVHDFHLWTLGPHIHAMSCHVLITDQAVSASRSILNELNEMLATRFGINHTTIQFECAHCDPNSLYCQLLMVPPPVPHAHEH